MDTPAPPPAPAGPSLKQRLLALEKHIKDMRRDLRETLELIDQLRESCVTAGEGKLAVIQTPAALLQIEAHARWQRLAPQQLVVLPESGAACVRILSARVGPEIERGFDRHALASVTCPKRRSGVFLRAVEREPVPPEAHEFDIAAAPLAWAERRRLEAIRTGR